GPPRSPDGIRRWRRRAQEGALPRERRSPVARPCPPTCGGAPLRATPEDPWPLFGRTACSVALRVRLPRPRRVWVRGAAVVQCCRRAGPPSCRAAVMQGIVVARGAAG